MVHKTSKQSETNYEKNCNFMKASVTLEGHPEIKGINFDKKVDLNVLLDGFLHTGFQATNLGRAMQVVQKMIDGKHKIILSMTGNTISTGLREIITYLCKHKKIDAIVTSAAGIEEDVVKTLKPFVIGDFAAPGNVLFDNGVGRIGNIFVPFDRYLHFEKLIDPFLETVMKEQKKRKSALSVCEFIKQLGTLTNNESSYLYWAAKNDIPVYCPAIQDGALGDLFYFFKRNNPDFMLDFFADEKKLKDFLLQEELVSGIILGGGISKHTLLNSAILREGLDSSVYLTTAQEFDGSDSGGNQEEAKTWAKVKVGGEHIKVVCDFSITFPLVIAATFARNKK